MKPLKISRVFTLLLSSYTFAQSAPPSPEWLKSGVIYQIFPRSFSQQGTLSGITSHLDELKTLGVNILWLMPIHPVGQVKKKGSLGSPYSVKDYYAIDASLGTRDDLKTLVKQAHQRGMKVIIDMVANHTAWDSVMMAHPEYYKKDKQGQITYPYDWTDVAALDYSNPKLRRYMTDMLIYWIKDFDLDGYRCDAAGEVPTDFWEQARVELDRTKPDIMMLAEASKPELMVKAFNIDYSWPLLNTLNEVVINGQPASNIHNLVEQQRAIFPQGTLHMRISDDHDELRATNRYGYAGAITVSAVVETLDGVPLIYNGMEAGDATPSHGSALFEPQKIFWDSADWHPDYPKFYAAINALRRQHAALQQGELIWIHNSDEQHITSYIRHSDSEEFLVVANLSNTPFRGSVDVSGSNWSTVDLPQSPGSQVGLPFVSLDAFGFRFFKSALK